jgi:hypothetical protein
MDLLGVDRRQCRHRSAGIGDIDSTTEAFEVVSDLCAPAMNGSPVPDDEQRAAPQESSQLAQERDHVFGADSTWANPKQGSGLKQGRGPTSVQNRFKK